jgi:predicted DNA-binding transcriptional regulator AlpA
VTALAREAGTPEKTIRRVTRELGPYPRPRADGAGAAVGITVVPAVVRQWVQDRRSAISTVAIARDSQTTAAKVRQATKRFGPFPSPQRAPAGYLTFRQVSARLGISRPALQRRLDHGELPTPAGRSDRQGERDSDGSSYVDADSEGGWPYWRAGDIEQWIAERSLDRCPICGAYLKRLDWHMISRHRQPNPPALIVPTTAVGESGWAADAGLQHASRDARVT